MYSWGLVSDGVRPLGHTARRGFELSLYDGGPWDKFSLDEGSFIPPHADVRLIQVAIQKYCDLTKVLMVLHYRH